MKYGARDISSSRSAQGQEAVVPEVLRPLPVVRTYADGTAQYIGSMTFSADEWAVFDQFTEAYEAGLLSDCAAAVRLWSLVQVCDRRSSESAFKQLRSVLRQTLAEDGEFRRAMGRVLDLVVSPGPLDGLQAAAGEHAAGSCARGPDPDRGGQSDIRA